MNERGLRPASVGAAALLIGGVLLLALPRYALGIVQVVIVTAAAAAALYALATRVPPTGWMSPYRWMSPFGGGDRHERADEPVDEADVLHTKLSGRRQPVADGPPMPADILRALRPLIGAALDLDPGGGPPPPTARSRLSPLTWSILTTEPRPGQGWRGTFSPDVREVAEVVHHVLDELERFDPGGVPPRPGHVPRDPHAP